MHSSWKDALKGELISPYFVNLQARLNDLRKAKVAIYPSEQEVFNAFELTPLDSVKVVILGQDPYHGISQAHGLSFSVRKGNRIPPSLRIIFKEMCNDIGGKIPVEGDLTPWAMNGVLLLNTILTVEHKKPGSHKNLGWEIFTDAAIKHVSDNRSRVVFFLWGKYAQSKEHLIDEGKHLVVRSPHPAAEVYQGGKAGFYGSKPFSRANEYLKENINWKIV